MRLLCLISLFFLISWKSTEYNYNEEQNIESEQMKIKAMKLQDVLGEDAGMATNCWSEETKQKKPTNRNKTYLQHSAPLAMISCVLCYQLGWTSDSTHLKLAMAALMHDMSVDDFYYSNINSWNQLARSSKEKSPTLERYKSHPSQAAQLSQTIKNLPPDVDQIILQHHEAPNSSGFPRSLSSSFIGPMSALFIIAEDLLEFIGEEKEDILKKLFDFVVSREKIYIEGSFKRVFQALKHHISVDNQ